ncbi:branched-chain amino acid transport system substrate-binding protein [Tardiphaga robiniae]|uniref:ABC transporter substrate-binding protein n=1 Tax=Tardiphaga robiniae TaxID=943830 RepID=UPI00285ACC71|nr:ABC transporter substrate-binding protein [Tardiphaga robiniae]MDR6663557.1 branched-chain amino acid transport system substrate-binding protein [Tardiphaga robiniae]
MNAFVRAALAASLLFGSSLSALAADILIGVNLPLTGAFAASGTYVMNGAKIAVEEINASGGVLGMPLKLIIEDNKSNPTEAAGVAEKLITRDKVPVMLGAWGSSLTLAAMPVIMDYKVPMLVETSGANKITESGNPYIFRISAPAALEARGFQKHLDHFKIKKADFLIINNDWGRSTAADFTKMFKENGIQVGLTELMDQTAQDLSAQLSKIKSSDAETLIVTTAVDQLTLVLKQIKALNLDRQVITTGGSQNPDQLIAQAGVAANNSTHLLFFTPWVPDATAFPERSKTFIDAWARNGFPPAGLTESFRGYDGINVIAAAIRKSGVAEPAAIRDAMWAIDVPALNGPVRFAKSGPVGSESGQSNPAIYFVKIVDGKVVMAP